QRDARILGQRRGHGHVDRCRTVDAHRGPGHHGRRGLSEHRGAHQGHDHPWRRERVPARDRGIPVRPPQGPGRAGHRRAGREVRRGDHGLGEAARGPGGHRGRDPRLLPRQDRPLQDPALRPLRRRVPHDGDRQGAEVPDARGECEDAGPRARRRREDGVTAVRAAMGPARGELWERRRDARRLLIVRAGHAAVYGRWFDGGEIEAWGPRAFATRFHPALDNADYRAALPERRRRLVDEQRDLLTGRTVLELGSHTGGLTAGIVRYAKRFTIIEANRRAVEVLAGRLGTRLQIVRGDLHRELWRRRPGAYDVIVCAGVLYHSAHPFWILEGIAHLAPRLVLIDTLNPARRTALGTAHTPGRLHHPHGRGPDCGVALNL